VTRALTVAAIGAVAMTVVLAVLRFGIVGPVPMAPSDDLVPLLIATGCLCAIGLARTAHRTVAWLGTIGAAFVVTLDLASYARLVRPDVSADVWRWLGIAVSIAALLAIGSAAGYAATRPRLRRRWLAAEGIAAVGAVSVVAGWAVTNPTDTTFVAGSALGSLGLVTRSFIVITAAFTAIGLVGDVLPAIDRARHRVEVTHGRTAPRGERAGAWVRAFVDELSPGRRRARRAALAERSRVARDIHADVVPGLRKALAEAERGAPADLLAASLRDVLADVEAVGAVQHPIQLEIGGLVAALEWLAERVQDRSDVTITLNVVDPTPEAVGEPPPEIGAAAFRIAALALDNVVRHASGSNVAVDIGAASEVVGLSICDDGAGITDAALASARVSGRRGIVDMAAEADECGGVLDVAPGLSGVGTCVRFGWRSAAADR
jgi:signal transduction histidine kinase